MTPSQIDFAIKSYANSSRRSRRLPVASPYAAQKNSRLANRLGSLMTIEFQTTGSSNCSLDENAFIYKSLAQHKCSKVQLVIVHCCCCCLYLVNKATESDISRSEIQFWITIFIYLSVPTIVISHTVVPNCVYSYLFADMPKVNTSEVVRKCECVNTNTWILRIQANMSYSWIKCLS